MESSIFEQSHYYYTGKTINGSTSNAKDVIERLQGACSVMTSYARLNEGQEVSSLSTLFPLTKPKATPPARFKRIIDMPMGVKRVKDEPTRIHHYNAVRFTIKQLTFSLKAKKDNTFYRPPKYFDSVEGKEALKNIEGSRLK
jgi:hypothetical protein